MKWTPAADAMLRRLYPRHNNKAIAERMGRNYAAIKNRATKLRLLKADDYVRPRFQKGMVPWNLGKTGYMGANRTSFRKGNYSPRWDRENYAVGALRINAAGGLDIKLADGLWACMARYVWETERGPIPKGGIVRTKNGDLHDTRIENLRLGTRIELMNENTYHRYPKEIANLIQLRGALQRQINKRERNAQHC